MAKMIREMEELDETHRVSQSISKRNQMFSSMRQDQVYTHMKDVISEYIKDNVQNVSKRV